jgi:hypothetical protein
VTYLEVQEGIEPMAALGLRRESSEGVVWGSLGVN